MTHKAPNLMNVEEELKKLQEFINKEDVSYDEIMNELSVDLKELENEFKNYSPQLTLGYTKLHSDAVVPKYNYPSDSGFDLHSVEDIEIPAFGRVLVPTGLSFDIKDGYEIQVRSKSGLAINQGLMVLNSPGTVDNGFLGEVKVIVFNTNNHSVKIPKGMKVGQAVLCPVVNGKWVNLEKQILSANKDRGDKAFGSTGI
jgi:dUTP pyrophosphatase